MMIIQKTYQNIKHHIFLWILLMGMIFLGNAQTYNFIYYGVESGLPQTQVKTIEQDDHGMLWIGTLAGLARYDGNSFEVFTKNNGLAEDWVTASYKDKDGNLWFGHWGGGVSKYNTITNQFTNYNLDQYTRFKTVTCITQDSSGIMWFGTDGSGVYKYNPKSQEENTQIKVFSLSASQKFPSDNITAITIDKYNNLWIGTDNGVVIFNTDKKITDESAYTYIKKINGLCSNSITGIISPYPNEMWLGTADSGVCIINIKEKISGTRINIKDKMHVLNKNNGLSSNQIECLSKTSSDNVLIGTKGGGLNIFILTNKHSIDQSYSQGKIQTFTTRQGLSYNNINVLFEDRDGSYWIGTDIGLNQYFGDRFIIYDERDGLANNLVWSIFEDKNHSMWFGTNEGLSKFTFLPSNSKYSIRSIIQKETYTVQNGLASDRILCLYEHTDGTLWVGTNNGVAYKTKDSKEFVPFYPDNLIRNTNVYAINSDKNGHIWFGTRIGAIKYDPVNKTYERYNRKNGLGGNHVFRLFKDSKDRLWFGFLGGFLTRYDGNKFSVFAVSSGMKDKMILCITEDLEGNMWFGSYGGGLYKYNNKEFINFSVNEGLSTDAPQSLACDNDNNIWIGTRKGVDMYNQKNNIFTHFGKQEGYLGIESNGNAICKDHTGNIWFGTIMGAVKVNTKIKQICKAEPITLINKLSIRHRNAPFPKDNTFAYADNYLTFHFIGISLTHPEKVRYQYQLTNFDDRWHPITNKNEAVYSNLPPGDYIFKVKAQNSDGLWNESPTEYAFTITPPFWRTIWFYLLSGSTLTFIIIFLIKYREQRLRKEKEYLEEQVQIRTLEIRSQKELLEKTNKDLAHKNNQITDSIDYAKRIQDAVLPPKSIINAFVKDSFILFKPKDIVSGDFYWHYRTEDVFLFAAIDCTGHGVPGAFMSIIGYNLLDQVVRDYQILEPNEILNKLNILLVQTLRQKSDNNSVKDGMEMALCKLNLKTNELHYAGTKHPLYIVRNKELIETKGDKTSIGSDSIGRSIIYTNHTFKMQPNDLIYIFSDGFADQKGGPKNKKFFYKPFKNLLTEISVMPMKEQHDILEKTIDDWRGNNDQIDDILILGIRI